VATSGAACLLVQVLVLGVVMLGVSGLLVFSKQDQRL
jgi:hypothetical protein